MATNPDPWAEFRVGGQPAAPAQPQTFGGTRVLGGVPPSERRAENADARADVTQVQAERRVSVAEGAEERAARKEARDLEDAARKQAGTSAGYQRAGQTVLRSTTRALEYLDNMSQGGGFLPAASRKVQAGIIGTDEYQFVRQIEDLKRNIGLDRLQQMRDNSPTGGALGQVPVQQQAMLEDTLGSFDITQPGETLRENLNQLNNIYLDIMFGSPTERAEAVQAGRMTPEQSREIDDMYRQTEFDEFGRRREPAEDVQASEDGDMLADRGDGILRGRVTDDSPRDTPPSGGGTDYSLSGIGTALAQGAGSMVEGVGDMVGIVTNPVGQTMYDAMGIDRQYDTGQILREATGLPANPNQLNDALIGGATAAFTGAGAARGAAQIATSPGVRNALGTIGATPVRDAAAGAGAGAGAFATRDMGPVAQVGGALAGGVAGYGAASGVARQMGQRAPNALTQAADRQGVDLLPADAGGPVARALTTGAKASPLSVGPVVNAAQRGQEQMRSAAGRAARGQGEVVDTDVAGQAIRRAAERFTQETSQRGRRMYERAEDMAKGVRIKPLRTVAALDEQITRLEQNPVAGGQLAEMRKLREQIAGGVSVVGLRDARTKLSAGTYDGQLRSSSEIAQWKSVLSNVKQDIDDGLRSVGSDDAADLFKQADGFWSQRVEVIDEVLQPILGKARSGEQIVQSIERMARAQGGDNKNLGRLLSNLDPEEAGNVRAAIVDRIGKANPGQQNAEGTAFSAATFLTNWNKMSPQARATLFRDKQLRNDLNDLAALAEGMRGGQAMSNFSNTGIAVGSNVAVGIGAAAAHPALAILGGGGAFLTGRLMASPGFARLLARTAKMPEPAARRTFNEQLGVLATREPALRGDIQSLVRAVNDNTSGSVAAEAEDQQVKETRPPVRP